MKNLSAIALDGNTCKLEGSVLKQKLEGSNVEVIWK